MIRIALLVPILILSMAGFSFRGGQFLQLVLTLPVEFFAAAGALTLGGVALIAGVLVFFFGRR
jgi:hypothetical protein